jgi:hypothetical protein
MSIMTKTIGMMKEPAALSCNGIQGRREALYTTRRKRSLMRLAGHVAK